ncbi:MAG: hypothetical protein KC441_18350 [Anaerolineales bacterium]|nr:hypothetical protein [Anaerolineales bacterium]
MLPVSAPVMCSCVTRRQADENPKKQRKSGPALLFLVMLTAVLPGAISHADNKPTAVSDSGDIFLPLVTAPDVSIPVTTVLTPFDANMSDLYGPSSWATNYGKTPEIVVVADGNMLHVLAQDYDPATPWQAVLLRLEPAAASYKVTQALTNLPMLDRVMGLAVDEQGNRYYATAVDESSLISPTYPPLDTYRSNIVRVVKVDPDGNVLFNVDLDIARHAFNNNAEMIINPMTFASARLPAARRRLPVPLQNPVHGADRAEIPALFIQQRPIHFVGRQVLKPRTGEQFMHGGCFGSAQGPWMWLAGCFFDRRPGGWRLGQLLLAIVLAARQRQGGAGDAYRHLLRHFLNVGSHDFSPLLCAMLSKVRASFFCTAMITSACASWLRSCSFSRSNSASRWVVSSTFGPGFCRSSAANCPASRCLRQVAICEE